MQLFRAGILNVRTLLMVGVEQHFVQASPIKHLSTFYTHREVLFFFRRKVFSFVGCHHITHSFQAVEKTIFSH